MEQARLDAIARMIQSESPIKGGGLHDKSLRRAKDKLSSSIKMDRKPEFHEDRNIKELQESYIANDGKHKKMDTFEQSKLDAIARLAQTNHKYASAAKKVQKAAILKTDYNDNDDDKQNNIENVANIRDELESKIRREVKQEYDFKFEQMKQTMGELLTKSRKKEQKLQQTVEELKESKVKLVLSTAAEIDNLRKALKDNCSS